MNLNAVSQDVRKANDRSGQTLFRVLVRVHKNRPDVSVESRSAVGKLVVQKLGSEQYRRFQFDNFTYSIANRIVFIQDTIGSEPNVRAFRKKKHAERFADACRNEEVGYPGVVEALSAAQRNSLWFSSHRMDFHLRLPCFPVAPNPQNLGVVKTDNLVA